ncbi:MAG: BMC domain-containing protein [Phycisphaerae bacterium]|nr:BMC domain-containing protein [Phycisphaerae bacterium]
MAKTVKSIGIIETRGFTPLVRAADTAVKAASVDIVEWRQVGSGFVSLVIEGEVAAVRSAVDAAVNAACGVGEVTSNVVIPRPVEELDATFQRQTKKAKK